MLKRLFVTVVTAAIVAAVVAWFLSEPKFLTTEETAQMENGDAIAGEVIFWAGGCGSCHSKEKATGEEKKQLGGGHHLVTPAGTFVTPNISPDKETGIGSWTGAQFANAMINGVSPNGSHYFPSFPYTSYARMKMDDAADLWAYMKTLPTVSRANEPHDLSILFSLRRGVGLWKWIFLDKSPVVPERTDPQISRGQYLVEGLGHCGECHTPRTLFNLGGTDNSAWLAGGPSPEGDGRIPNITPHKNGIGGWTTSDISEYLASGFTPDFDSVGGTMVSVQENMAKLTKADRDAIAAYLKSIPAVASN